MLEALSLQQSQGAHTLTDSGLNSRSQTEMWSLELHTKIHVRGSKLNLLPLKEEMDMRGL